MLIWAGELPKGLGLSPGSSLRSVHFVVSLSFKLDLPSFQQQWYLLFLLGTTRSINFFSRKHRVIWAFFWLVSLLLASLVWFISIHLSDQENKRLQHLLLMFGATVSVLLQEAFRFAHFKLLKKADEGLVTISEDGRSPISTKQMAYVSGLSFGIISGVFSVINILADSIGPGTVGIHGDSPYYFITSAFLTMALVFLHTFWGVVFFDACETRRYWKLALVVVSHLVISGLTFLNPYYEASLIPIFLITVSTGVWAFFTAGGSLRNILACLSCREKENGHIMVYSELQLPMED
ncbi:gamma-secretase subunit APH-1A isoform X3 [Crotalus tigris]|uniref:gamma-secretase subunit APH-1A isoform X3 n=1 Tax=Crotalus tigris TaxID=88082 RepID=UPI00192F988F|nr:gamma-secretase subunit APH-1A isoform X3 [Crotalus tigris]